MKNYEWLSHITMYDFLMKYVVKELHMCPISFLGKEKKSSSYCKNVKCGDCLNDWLNEEQ